MQMPSDMGAFNQAVVEEFRANDGVVVSVGDGMFAESKLALITTTGARTGLRRSTPVGYITDGPDRIVLWASNMAAASHPAWYRNLRANPSVFVEYRTDSGVESFEARATTAQGRERDRLLGALREKYPHMADHQHRTEREIPLVICQRVS